MSSWASVVAKNLGSQSEDGETAISEEESLVANELVREDHLLISEDSSSDCFSCWKHGLVGRFVAGSQPIAVIRAALEFYWGRSRSFEILQACKNGWIILFESEKDMLWALHNGPWAICGRILFLERWVPNFDFSSAVQTKVSIWLLLPDLPKKLLPRSAVIALASRVGLPIAVDDASLVNGSQRCARVKILCDLAVPLLQGFRIEINGFSLWQRFQFGGLIKPCSSCGVVGHSPLACLLSGEEKPRGRSKSRRRNQVGRKSLRPSARPSDTRAEKDRVTSSEVSSGAEQELFVHLTGSVEAEGEAEWHHQSTGLHPDSPAQDIGGEGLQHEQVAQDINLLLKYNGSVGPNSEIPRSDVGVADSEGEDRGTFEPSRDGKAVVGEESDSSSASSDSGEDCIAGASNKKARVPKIVHSVTRETRSRSNAEGPSIADLFRAAGAKEGLKVKARKNPKVAKATAEL